MAGMATKRVTVGAMSAHPGTRQTQARTRRGKHSKDQEVRRKRVGSPDEAGQTLEPEAETGPRELGAYGASQTSRSFR